MHRFMRTCESTINIFFALPQMNFNDFFSSFFLFSLCRPNLKLISNRFHCRRPFWIVVQHRFVSHTAAHRRRYRQTRNPHAQLAIIASTKWIIVNHLNRRRARSPRHRLASNWSTCWTARRTRSHRLTSTIIPRWPIWMQRSGKFVAAIHRHRRRRTTAYRRRLLHLAATAVAPAQSIDSANRSIRSRRLFAMQTTTIISISITITTTICTISIMPEIIIWCRWRCQSWATPRLVDQESTMQCLTTYTVCTRAIAIWQRLFVHRINR